MLDLALAKALAGSARPVVAAGAFLLAFTLGRRF